MGVRRPIRSEAGAAMAEFVIIVPFFLFLLFGIISYSAMFSFRQTLSQAATEGARAAVVAPTNFTFSDRSARAVTSVNLAFAGDLGTTVQCGTGGLTCAVTVPTSCSDCIAVALTYAYAAHPRIPVPQFLGFTLPTQLRYTASARIK